MEARMSNDKTHHHDADRSRISLTEPHEVRYWTHALGISEERLREVVGKVGHSSGKVRAELGIKDEPTEGDGGPTGSGGVAAGSPSRSSERE
jgi:hypothetical protein